VHDQCSYDYAIIRVVPRVERQEFVNVGVILICTALDFLAARIEVDEERLLALDPEIDLGLVQQHLASIPAICSGGPEAGPIGELPPRGRFDWLAAPRSTVIQVSPVHTGRCEHPEKVLGHLLRTMVRPVKRGA